MRNFLLSLFVLVFSVYGHAQKNLVYNPSFEDNTECPTNLTAFELKSIKGWFQTTAGSVDYYNKCDKNGAAGVPHNSQGYQCPKSGKAYIGMELYEKDGYREYISTKLECKLKAGTKYCVKLYVSLAESSRYAISDIQVLFSPEAIKSSTTKRLEFMSQLSYSQNNPITDTANWVEIRWNYVAKGDELYMTIGNFTKNNQCKVVRTNSQIPVITKGAYYYIDDVCVAEMKNDSTCDCGEKSGKDTTIKTSIKTDSIPTQSKQLVIEANKNIILNNVVFETDKSDVLPASFDELNQLAAYLQTNATARIVINGYTDNTGNQEKNLSLSRARAKAVADYLISKGIEKLRVSYKGYGSANPIVSNDTEEGRAKNRRVEFNIENITH